MDLSFQKYIPCCCSYHLYEKNAQYVSGKCKSLERILCLSCNTSFPSWVGRNSHTFYPFPTSPRKDHLCTFSFKNTTSLYSAEKGSRRTRTHKIARTNAIVLQGCILFCASDNYTLLYFYVLLNPVQSDFTIFVSSLKRVYMHQYSWIIHGGVFQS